MSELICAIATAPGVGGIAVIRLSGSGAFALVAGFLHKGGVSLSPSQLKPRQARYAEWWSQGELIDEVVALPFVAPHSYTGEDVVEISCHGSSYITQRILSDLTQAGARIARPGEFTQRAFLSGKMDLSSAEAVADVIAAESKAQHQLALTQMRGGYSEEFEALRERLLTFASLMELELDFAEEEVEFADRRELLQLCEQVQAKIKHLTDSYQLGNAIRRGIPVAIIGITNAGKSTLLNRLIGEERAIVSDIHGTTRDTIEELININGLLFRFIDTAGLRDTEDSIEALGIERSKQKLREASLVLAVLDGTHIDEVQLSTLRTQLQERTSGEGVLLLINKADTLPAEQHAELQQRILSYLGKSYPALFISAKENLALDTLRTKLTEMMQLPSLSAGDIVVSNARHHALLKVAGEALERLHRGLTSDIPTDLLTPELRLAIAHIGEITGREISREETLHNIFRHFCIGK